MSAYFGCPVGTCEDCDAIRRQRQRAECANRPPVIVPEPRRPLRVNLLAVIVAAMVAGVYATIDGVGGFLASLICIAVACYNAYRVEVQA